MSKKTEVIKAQLLYQILELTKTKVPLIFQIYYLLLVPKIEISKIYLK